MNLLQQLVSSSSYLTVLSNHIPSLHFFEPNMNLLQQLVSFVEQSPRFRKGYYFVLCAATAVGFIVAFYHTATMASWRKDAGVLLSFFLNKCFLALGCTFIACFSAYIGYLLYRKKELGNETTLPWYVSLFLDPAIIVACIAMEKMLEDKMMVISLIILCNFILAVINLFFKLEAMGVFDAFLAAAFAAAWHSKKHWPDWSKTLIPFYALLVLTQKHTYLFLERMKHHAAQQQQHEQHNPLPR